MFFSVIICAEVSLRFSWLEFSSSTFLTGVELEDLRNHNSQPESSIKEDTAEAAGFQEWSVVVDFSSTPSSVPKNFFVRPTMTLDTLLKSNSKQHVKTSMMTCSPSSS